MEHQGTKTIETERLILRKFTADDLSAIFHNWTSDEKVTEFLRWPTHKSIDITKRVLESWLLEYEKPDFYQWAIIPKEIGEPIGTISVIELNEKTEKVHIGYCLGSRWWHCGFTSAPCRGTGCASICRRRPGSSWDIPAWQPREVPIETTTTIPFPDGLADSLSPWPTTECCTMTALCAGSGSCRNPPLRPTAMWRCSWRALLPSRCWTAAIPCPS